MDPELYTWFQVRTCIDSPPHQVCN